MSETATQSSRLTEILKPKSFSTEKENIREFFKINAVELAIILGISISGLIAVINMYDAVTGINDNMIACANTDELGSQLTTQFIVVLTFSIVFILLGLILIWVFRTKPSAHIFIFSIILVGVFGIVYSLAVQFQQFTNNAKMLVSWSVFIAFIVIGIFYTFKKSKEKPEE